MGRALWSLLLLYLCAFISDAAVEREAFDGNGVIVPEKWPEEMRGQVTVRETSGRQDHAIEGADEIIEREKKKRALQGVPDTAAPTMAPTTPNCDLQAFDTWKNEAYVGILLTDPSFWRYQTQLQFQLSNGLALDLAVAKCKERLLLLSEFKAGRTGPVDVQNIWKAMCKDECMQSDVMHEMAMDASGCNCLELSTSQNDTSYRVEGDWCLHNSARLLCDLLGFCGRWGCRIDDFMCPRYEWNKKLIPLKGLGSCDRTVYTGAELKKLSEEEMTSPAARSNHWQYELILSVLAIATALLMSDFGIG